jgi:hypothetical protein
VVVADEVEKAVDQEMRDLARERPPGGSGLRPRALDGDVDFPQEEVPVAVCQIPRLGERKGKHVGGAVGLQKIPVQGPDARVVGEDERDRGAWVAQAQQRAAEKRPKSGRS